MRQIIILALICACATVKSQNVEIGVMGGLSFYGGDLSPAKRIDYLQESHPAIGLFGRVNFNSLLSGRISLNYGKLTGSDINNDNQTRGLNFRTNFIEANVVGELNLARLGGQGATVVPYIFAGVGFFNFNPEGNQGNGWVELQPLGTEGQGLPGFDDPYSLTQISFPVGGGIKFIFNQSWALGVEFGSRILFFDYIDDVGNTELVYEVLRQGNGEVAAQFSNPNLRFSDDATQTYSRGSGSDDWYYVTGVTLSYFFGPAGQFNDRGNFGKCPKF